ncbi:MAG: 3'(2'),5'-bisphosphate nucleotidase CysQ [Aphanocapsa sp. GSE-SYN-MK-11-07L]|jgi:3'(2'), 5'-bisphosphate nucleotidase|nr:3'(2'),5'-bisphosphate nucleotidase CysQ [Aphanocapsa sp. GSE-SYN-MK-11-07L]
MLPGLLELAKSVGWGAADILQSYYHSDRDLKIQKQDTEPVTAADLAVNSYILERLQAELDPQQFGYLTEETWQPGPPFSQPYVWIVDPLDGTRDFIQKTGEYAVHIALVKAGRPVLAVVAWPEAGKLYFATSGAGAYIETRVGEASQNENRQVKPLAVSKCAQPEAMRLVVSRSHRDQRFNNLLERLPQTQQTFVGSVGCKIATIVEQQAEIYLSLTTKSAPKDWDLAAPELILTEAGGQFSHFDLTPLVYNQGDVSQWGGFLASNGQGHAQLCEQIQAILQELEA